MIIVSSSIPGEEGRKVIVNPAHIVSIRQNGELGGSVIELSTGKVVLCAETRRQLFARLIEAKGYSVAAETVAA